MVVWVWFDGLFSELGASCSVCSVFKIRGAAEKDLVTNMSKI